jgi:biopolymer transport protein ExbB
MRGATRFLLATLLGGALIGPAAGAESAEPAAVQSLDQLLERVRQGNVAENDENARREAEFRSGQAEQERMLREALQKKAALERRSAELERQFEANEARIPELEQTLHNRQGSLGELFGAVRQIAGDLRADVESSIISAELPGRDKFLYDLSQSRVMPSIDELEKLWFSFQQEMTETGKVARFPATVIAVGGGQREQQVVRVGPFNAVSEGQYLQYLPETGKLAELGRQPGRRHLASAAALEAARAGLVGFSIDPSRGSILSLLIQTPDRRERIDQGGPIGYVTIVLGVFGFLLGVYRLVYMGLVGRKVRAQIDQPRIDMGNPLGRVLSVYDQNQSADTETLELKLDEAILKETPQLERGNGMIKLISVIAPLLGLLGTVTGMIKTFQVMTLFGSGDPKLMASGIAEALVTTMIGLMVAIPLTFLHALVASRSKSLIQILEEQSAGIVAAQAEAQHGPQVSPRAAAG